MKVLHCAAVVALVYGASVFAQGAPVPVREVAQPTAGSVLPTNTEIVVKLNQELSSKTVKKVGTKFDLTVANDVMLGNYVVIPRGTPAVGHLSYRTGKGAFGKSAKIEIDLDEVNLNGRMIPITGHYRQEGRGNTGATVGTVVAAGVFGALVTGRSAIYPQGYEFKAYTKEAVPISVEPPVKTAVNS